MKSDVSNDHHRPSILALHDRQQQSGIERGSSPETFRPAFDPRPTILSTSFRHHYYISSCVHYPGPCLRLVPIPGVSSVKFSSITSDRRFPSLRLSLFSGRVRSVVAANRFVFFFFSSFGSTVKIIGIINCVNNYMYSIKGLYYI